jgi:hypothetical protein
MVGRRMRFRFQKRKHLTLDVGTGDILAETGDILIVGRISPASPLTALMSGRPYEELDKLLLKPTRYFHCEGAAWPHVFSIQWTARARSTPDSPSYHAVILAVQQIERYLLSAGLLKGDVRIGMLPFSWRSPMLVARIMHDCLRDLFVSVRDHPHGSSSLHVVVRSLTEFPELTALLVRDLPVRHGLLGLPLTPWVPDDAQLETAPASHLP